MASIVDRVRSEFRDLFSRGGGDGQIPRAVAEGVSRRSAVWLGGAAIVVACGDVPVSGPKRFMARRVTR